MACCWMQWARWRAVSWCYIVILLIKVLNLLFTMVTTLIRRFVCCWMKRARWRAVSRCDITILLVQVLKLLFIIVTTTIRRSVWWWRAASSWMEWAPWSAILQHGVGLRLIHVVVVSAAIRRVEWRWRRASEWVKWARIASGICFIHSILVFSTILG